MFRNATTQSLLVLLLCFTSGLGKAQCSFTPSVFPANILMCPNTQDTIWTQTYNSYQWYKNGIPIPGATQQYYVVDYWLDAASYFKVGATLNGCTEVSDSVLVDGLAFLPPYAANYGNMTLCPGIDSVIFWLGTPYTVNIQWSNNGVPIAGATDDSLVVYSPGNYTVQGAPASCPNHIVTLGVVLVVNNYQQPQISPLSMTLCNMVPDSVSALQPYTSYQWYNNGIPITGATQPSLSVKSTGSYFLMASQGTCVLPSDTLIVGNYTTGTVSIVDQGGILTAVTSSPGMSNYQWYFNNAPVIGANTSTHSPAQPGVYSVTVQDSTCIVRSNDHHHQINSISPVTNKHQVIVSPNPVDDYLNIIATGDCEVVLQGLDGRTVYHKEGAGKHSLAYLPAGLYILSVHSKMGELLHREKVLKR